MNNKHTIGDLRQMQSLPLQGKIQKTRQRVKEWVEEYGEDGVCNTDIMITNYERERDGNIEPTYFIATSLDEASVLRSFGSKTYQTFLDKFKGVPYKLVATATPSPNKYSDYFRDGIGYLQATENEMEEPTLFDFIGESK